MEVQIMKKNLTELVFILDRSGSMSGLEADTIGGYNSLLEKQKREEGEAYVSTVLFDHETEVLHDRVKLQDLKLSGAARINVLLHVPSNSDVCSGINLFGTGFGDYNQAIQLVIGYQSKE